MVLIVPAHPFSDNSLFVKHQWCLKCPVSAFLSFSLSVALAWGEVAGPFHCEVWLEKVSLANLQIKVSLPLADCLSLTHTHIFPGSTSHFTACWVTWCDTSAIYWQIWDSWGKECFLTFPPSPHAPLAPNRGKMKTNTVGFVVRQKPAALNLHDSSHTLPLVPVEAGQRRGKNAFFQIYFCLFT